METKKVLGKMVCIVMVLMLAVSATLVASASEPAKWAMQEMKLARYEALYPSVLAEDYQKSITRSEFTLLALSYYEKAGKVVGFTSNPFSDIEGHPYKAQILKAYHAGIIDGYPDGSFKPDNYIMRDEMAALIVKLLRAVDSNADVAAQKTYAFTDAHQISAWALPYVTYCYEQEIMRGTATLTISPLSSTSREQAGVLIYRLALKKGVVDPVSEEQVEEMPLKEKDNLILGQDNLVAFEETFGDKGKRVLQNLIAYTDFDTIEISADSMHFEDGSTTIIFEDMANALTIAIGTKNVYETLTKEAVDIVLEITDESETLVALIDSHIRSSKNNESFDFRRLIGGKYYVLGFEFLDDNQETKHFIRIIKDK